MKQGQHGRQPGFLFGWLLCLPVLYFFFTGSITWSDAAVGAGCLVLTLVAALTVRDEGLAAFRLPSGWFAAAVGLPWQVVRDTVTVVGALFQSPAKSDALGQFSTARFPAGGDDPQAEARRALVVLYTSFAPNTYIVHIDREKGMLLYHELVPQGTTPEPVKKLRSG
ncbi:MAG: hypothetical protein ACJ78Q_17040 [Chloroflexia bacterium]